MAATLTDHAVLLACLLCVILTTVAFVGRTVNRSFGGASRQISGAIFGSEDDGAHRRASVERRAPGALADNKNIQLPFENVTLVVAFAAVAIAFLGSRLLRNQLRQGQEEQEEQLEQGPSERYIYLRRQKILQKLFNNTEVLFKCRLLVRDLMSEEIEVVAPHTKVADLAMQITENRLPHVFVVTDDGRLLGIIHQQDIRLATSGNAKDIMTPNSSTVRPDEPLTHAISMILNEDRWTLPVVEGGYLRGEITRTDLAITLQCVFQVFLRIGQFAQAAPQGEDNVASSVRATLSAQRERLHELTNLVLKHAKDDTRGPWRTICQEAEGLLETTKRLAHDVEKAADGLDQRMQNLMTLFVPRIDALTGLCTRKGLEETLDSMCAMNRRYKQAVSLLLVRFETSGEPNGESNQSSNDERLRQWGKWLDAHMRETDIVGRYADEIFGVVLPHTDQEGARLCKTRLGQEFSKSALADGTTSMITGMATASPSTGATDLMKQAEEALKSVPAVNAT
jgi:diguanylate cyclase (GGDEF)-like protein